MKTQEPIKSQSKSSVNQKVLLNITHTKNLLKDGLSEILKHYNLSHEQFNILQLLRDLNGKPANMFTIQERMREKNSNATRLVDKLLLKNLVLRKVCDENRRKIEIFITKKGLTALKNTEYKVLHYEMKFAENMTLTEITQLNRLLEKYRNINN
ncbi:MarR family transcriptional regulator [Flavobacterium sp. LC2016-01]|uniref:MarR family winged helix-turn-helix transcriptional regulator n=1 Tax=Flavobacterium sp. LC2016-01 TaxID=2675876 RepID=UPI0012BAE87C|nr:MarR family transcriptional regulator [Flavobacterium sp. LC2016-01]MTH17626.1 MarR family transcriptional regulator [Flavobacterium sp. LC2016-01]